MALSIKCKAYVTSWYPASQELGIIEPPTLTLYLESESLTDAIGSKNPAVVNKVLASVVATGIITVTLEAI